MEIRITGLKALSDKLDALGRKVIAQATAASLRDTASQVQAGVKSEMRTVFNRPNPWALSTVRVDTSEATKTKQTAAVGFSYERGTASQWETPWFIPPEVHGGSRDMKPSERQLRAAGILPQGMFIAPARDAWLDSYGNIPGPTMVQILSSVKAFGETGYLMNRTGKSRSKTANRYFVMRKAGRPIGIWERLGKNNARAVIMFIHKPAYKARLNFYMVANQIINSNWKRNFNRRLKEYKEYAQIKR